MFREQAFKIARDNAQAARDNPYKFDDPVQEYRTNVSDTLNEEGCTDAVLHDLAMQEFDRLVAA